MFVFFHDGHSRAGNDSSVDMDFAFQLKYLDVVESHQGGPHQP